MEEKIIFRQGNLVTLRPVVAEDIPSLTSWINDPENTQYLLRREPISIEMEREWFDRSSQNKNGYLLAIVENKGGKIIGTMGIHQIDHFTGTAVTGTVIGNAEFQGKGYGTEAKMLLLGFAFWELNLRKIYSYVIEYNKRSARYSEKCGYREEARLPKHYYKKGQYWDQIILAVYREEWEKVAHEFFAKIESPKKS